MSHEARIKAFTKNKWSFNTPPCGKTRKDDALIFRADCYFEAITDKKRNSNSQFSSKRYLQKGL